jgi:formylglycine-generating enzyme required for sulfatase activity
VSRFQLEIAKQHKEVLSFPMVPLLHQLSRRASRDSPLQDYIFREFMAGLKPSRLAVHMPSGKIVPLGLSRRRFLQLAGWTSVGLGGGLLLHRGLRTQAYMVATIDAKGQDIQCQPARNTFQTIHLPGGISLDMMRIPSGSFMMGQTEAEKVELIRQVGEQDYKAWYANELPQHQVTLAAFSMGKYPVTQAQYQAVMGNNPSNFKGDNRPVEGVSWHEAMEFCDRLSKKLGQPYTLPSEAQWEYACRAGTTTPFHFGETITTDLANYDGTGTFASGPKGVFRQETTDVGLFPANRWGLYDMHGNVFEWCLDHFHDSYNGAPADGSAWVTGGDSDFRMLRGGSWYFDPGDCRCASRLNLFPDIRYFPYGGFRVVSVPPRALG